MKRSMKLGLTLAAAFALPTAVSAQAANHVSWGLQSHGNPRWNPFVAGPGGPAAFFAEGGSWSLGVSLGAGYGGHVYDPWGRDCGYWGHGHDHWGHGCARSGYGYGHCDGFFGCPYAHPYSVLAGAPFGWSGWGWTPFVSLGWPSWRSRVFARFVYGPVWGWGGWDPDPFWHDPWYRVGFGYSDPYYSRGGHVVAERGYRGAGRRDGYDRPVRRSPLFGPRYKENPRVYVTDNGPERPTSRAVPRDRDVAEAQTADGGRRGRPSESVRKAKPRGSATPNARAPRRSTRTGTGPATRAKPRTRIGTDPAETGKARPRPGTRRPPRTSRTDPAKPPSTGPAPRSARPRQPRPEAARQPDRRPGWFRVPQRPRQPSVNPRPPARVRPDPQRGGRRPSAWPAPRGGPPKVRPAPRNGPPKARPAPRRTPPRAKPAPTRRPAPKRTPPARRPAKRRGK